MAAAVFSLVAALLYAAASVLQHRAAVEAPRDQSLRVGLLGYLARKPWWVAGVAADAGGYVAQFVALGHGPLVIVQPLLVSGLLFALPLGAFLGHRRITGRELWAAGAVVIGLAALLLAAYPEPGHANATPTAWTALMLATLVPSALLVVGALRLPSVKPALLATSAGIVYGLTAALTKVTAHELGLGVGHVLTSWQFYVLIAVGIIGMVLTQSAFQAGPLRASLPSLTVADPVVSVLIGITAFHEHVDQSPLRIAVGVTGALVMGWGVVALASQIADDRETAPGTPDAHVH
ncbi:MAG TPA: DMT family transporter [Acidimicrobiales bacterium]|nr:DMT family transporter [Acidimicrobiales bacterium]